MAFGMKCTGGPYGDSCSSYDIIFDREYTVKEFIEEVLKEKPGEWGEFTIEKDLKHTYTSSLDNCEYKYGKITKGFKKTESESMRIEEVKANGGWSLMNYFIKAIEG